MRNYSTHLALLISYEIKLIDDYKMRWHSEVKDLICK